MREQDYCWSYRFPILQTVRTDGISLWFCSLIADLSLFLQWRVCTPLSDLPPTTHSPPNSSSSSPSFHSPSPPSLSSFNGVEVPLPIQSLDGHPNTLINSPAWTLLQSPLLPTLLILIVFLSVTVRLLISLTIVNPSSILDQISDPRYFSPSEF